MCISLSNQRGQASVELLGVVPAVLLAGLVAWQVVVAGHALWLTSHAARVAARAEAVGASPSSAARSALPRSFERGLSVERRREGGVRVSVHVPLVPAGWRGPVRLSASSSFGRSRR